MSVLAVNCRAIDKHNLQYTTPQMTFYQRYLLFSTINNPPVLSYHDFILANERKSIQIDHDQEIMDVAHAANVCFQNAKRLFDEARKSMGNKASVTQSSVSNPSITLGLIVHGTEKLMLDSIMVATKV